MPATSFFDAGVRPFPLCCFDIVLLWVCEQRYIMKEIIVPIAAKVLAPLTHVFRDYRHRFFAIAAATIPAGLQYKIILTMMVGNTAQRLY
ncbi:hypothetical protein C8F04DRAFT_1283543 [Mycena alexandri]|uniref:Uncharacterized protein n=1 Tax=Mycena alexandri TaxID=1745969 RepID=A0AAD6WPC4_9AGAR|nr:hypothetical protein C8F04DRAFT_1283543 [Mycena alexandri]